MIEAWLAQHARHSEYKFNYSLKNVQKALDVLGLSCSRSKIITIAGTNGKGSTAELLSAFLRCKKMSVGVFSSPHLFKVNERIAIDGSFVSDTVLLSALKHIDNKSPHPLSYFEYLFLAAFYIFNQKKVSHMILEVGLGGRLDAVNAVENDLAVITSIDYDHMDLLGSDIGDISYEKAGIFRAKKPAVVAVQEPHQRLLQMALKLETQIHLLGQDFHYRIDSHSWSWQSRTHHLERLSMPLLQVHNASTVLAILEQLEYLELFSLTEINQLLESTRLMGRGTILRTPGLQIFDVAHNRASVAQLRKFLLAQKGMTNWHGVFSMHADKELEWCIRCMADVVDHWHIAALSDARGASISKLKSVMETEKLHFHAHSTIHEAYQKAVANLTPDCALVVWGSFSVLSEVMDQTQMRQ